MDENMKELIGTVNELLLNLIKRIDDIYNSELTGNLSGEERILNLLEDLGALSEGISEIGRFFNGVDITELQEKLSFMAEALERKDSLLFADTMLYELKPLLEYWNGLLSNR